MLTTTQDKFEDFEIEKTIGLVRGNTIRTKNIGYDLVASLRTIVGGEIPEYTKMMNESREEAFKRMIQEAQMLGADAVVGLRFGTSSVLPGSAEFLCYGTAVTLKK
ncbi:protein of unknown function DUF74 [Methanococcus vannielii SB]|uniref:UPF0145 protein Mevan_1624 n=1 Tax=Methanococcus vannielii (strain ATCC 35089 / DSM 1224 / JCM 13029 / OCM 148 / SB) TaxID=406327 RepID=Y1624_METVS|nr:YbjQ family protein [Methanococcus vannielii]A6USP4.1 RecName: Full=UPF0145 protein Mevan_1624 [Methanococcus vannielii SB]ABR55516.1 protein of unknown function DUF74 [Methanococcus vannielii SB]